MIKNFLIAMFVLASVSSFAVTYKTVDEPNWKTEPQAYLDYWISVDAPASKMAKRLELVSTYQIKLDTNTTYTKASIIALVDANANSFGITDANDILAAKVATLFYAGVGVKHLNIKNDILVLIGENQDYRVLQTKAAILFRSGKYMESLAVYQAIENLNINIYINRHCLARQMACALKTNDMMVLLSIADKTLLINTTKNPKDIIALIAKFETLPVSNNPVVLAGILDKLIDLSAKYPPAIPKAGTEADWARAAAMVDYRIAKLQKLVNAKIDLANKLEE